MMKPHRDHPPLPIEEEIAAYTGPNNRYFLYKWHFTRFLGRWNWAAFAVGPLWFALRKQYAWSLILATAYIWFDFHVTANPFHLTFCIELMLFSGLTANSIYLAAFEKNRRAAAHMPDRLTQLRQNGGRDWTAMLTVLAGMLIATLLLPPILGIHLFGTKVRRIELSSLVFSRFLPDLRSQELGLLQRDYQRAYFQGRFNPAIRLAENAVRLATLRLGLENHLTMALQSDLLEFKMRTGDFRGALDLNHALLRRYQSRFGEDHLFVLFMMNQLASNYIYQGRYDEARPLLNNCLITLEKYPKNLTHPVILAHLALIYSNLGVIHQAYCQYDQAEKFHTEALNLAAKSSKGYSLASCMFLERMGDFYRDMLKPDQAEDFYNQAKDIAGQSLGTDNPLASSIDLKLGATQLMKNQLLQAEYLTAHAQVVNEKYYGPSHAATAAASCQLGRIYFSQGKFQDARFQFEQALDMTAKAIGKENAVYAAQLIFTADLDIFQNRLKAAHESAAHALALYEQIYGRDNAMVLIPLEQMQLLAEKEKNGMQAHLVAERILAIQEHSVWRPASKLLHRLNLDDPLI